MNLEEKKLIVVTHQMVYGAPQALKDYLIQKNTQELVFIGLPFHEQRMVFFEIYKKKKKIFLKHALTNIKQAEIFPGNSKKFYANSFNNSRTSYA